MTLMVTDNRSAILATAGLLVLFRFMRFFNFLLLTNSLSRFSKHTNLSLQLQHLFARWRLDTRMCVKTKTEVNCEA